MLPLTPWIVLFEAIWLAKVHPPATSIISVSPEKRSATARLITRKLVRVSFFR